MHALTTLLAAAGGTGGHRPALALGIFVLTYVIVAAPKVPFTSLDRASGALLGAVLMVATGILAPADIYAHAVSWDTLGLLLGMMVIVAYLAEAGFFRAASHLTLKLAQTPRGLLAGITLTSAALSALFVNDTVCVMVTPLVLQTVKDAKQKPLPFLLAVSMGANAGSVATFTGNPQNMLIGQMSGISFARFAAVMTPIALVASVLCALVLMVLFRRELPAIRFHTDVPMPPSDRALLLKSALAALGVVIAFFAGANEAWAALAGAAFLCAVGGREPRQVMERGVDFVLLVFFAGLFVVIHGLDATGWTGRMLEVVKPLFGSSLTSQLSLFSLVSLVASNIFSNVPFVMLAAKWIPAFPSQPLMWMALALSSTLAGNLTLIGSVANLIVAESARETCEISFMDYLRRGIPVTLVTTAVGVAMLLAFAALGLV